MQRAGDRAADRRDISLPRGRASGHTWMRQPDAWCSATGSVSSIPSTLVNSDSPGSIRARSMTDRLGRSQAPFILYLALSNSANDLSTLDSPFSCIQLANIITPGDKSVTASSQYQLYGL
jgi:hypothetical protein